MLQHNTDKEKDRHERKVRKMRTVIQRVSQASVSVNGSIVSRIGQGLLLLLGIEAADTEEDIQWLSRKVLGLRIFDDEEGIMKRFAKAYGYKKASIGDLDEIVEDKG